MDRCEATLEVTPEATLEDTHEATLEATQEADPLGQTEAEVDKGATVGATAPMDAEEAEAVGDADKVPSPETLSKLYKNSCKYSPHNAPVKNLTVFVAICAKCLYVILFIYRFNTIMLFTFYNYFYITCHLQYFKTSKIARTLF